MRFLLFVWRSEYEYGESEPTQNKNPVRAKFYIYSEMEYKIHNSIIWKFIYKKKVCFFFFFGRTLKLLFMNTLITDCELF